MEATNELMKWTYCSFKYPDVPACFHESRTSLKNKCHYHGLFPLSLSILLFTVAYGVVYEKSKAVSLPLQVGLLFLTFRLC